MEKKAVVDSLDNNVNVCTDLTLGQCCSCTTLNSIGSDSSSFTTNKKKRKLLGRQETTNNKGAKRKKKGFNSNNQEEEKRRNLSWDCTTELKLYDDPWKIKKVLVKSDIGNRNQLMIGTEMAEKLILPPVLGVANVYVGSDNGIYIRIKDVDTNSMHTLLFKKWVSSKSYVFIEKWRKDFVVRRGLKKGDEIGLHWDPYNNLFNFSLLKAAAAGN